MSKCRTCQAEILWIKTQKGLRTPVNVDPVIGYVLGPPDSEHDATPRARESGVRVYVSHFATCPDAAAHRSKR